MIADQVDSAENARQSRQSFIGKDPRYLGDLAAKAFDRTVNVDQVVSGIIHGAPAAAVENESMFKADGNQLSEIRISLIE